MYNGSLCLLTEIYSLTYPENIVHMLYRTKAADPRLLVFT